MKLKAAVDIFQLFQTCEDIAKYIRAKHVQMLDRKIINQTNDPLRRSRLILYDLSIFTSHGLDASRKVGQKSGATPLLSVSCVFAIYLLGC